MPPRKPKPDRQRASPTKAERVQHCVELMASGSWVTGVTGPRLASEWGLGLSAVEHDAAEASRRVHEQSDDKHLRTRIQATLETITERAMKRGQLRTAVESVKALAGISGAEAPKKIDVGIGLEELDALRDAVEHNACSSSEANPPRDPSEPNFSRGHSQTSDASVESSTSSPKTEPGKSSD